MIEIFCYFDYYQPGGRVTDTLRKIPSINGEIERLRGKLDGTNFLSAVSIVVASVSCIAASAAKGII